MKAAHKLIVITGATGTGKTTVSAYLRDNYRIHRVMTHTTRPPRTGEQTGLIIILRHRQVLRLSILLKKSLMPAMNMGHHMSRWRRTGLSIPS